MKHCWARCWCCCGSLRTTILRHARFILSLHLANTLLLLAALALSAHFLGRRQAFDRQTVRFTQMPFAITGLVSTVAVGMTGTLAALSDTLFPVASVSAALTQDFSSGSNWLERLRFLHPVTAVIAGAFVCWLLLRSVSRPRERSLAKGVILLLALQCGLGVADVVLLAPLWMQILHLLGADILWIALVLLAAQVCVVSREPISA